MQYYKWFIEIEIIRSIIDIKIKWYSNWVIEWDVIFEEFRKLEIEEDIIIK